MRERGLMCDPASWPSSLPVAQVRIARPTRDLGQVLRFYRDGLGLRVLGSFEDHDGYSGVMLGLPGPSCHLEFTTCVEGPPCPQPSPDDLLVLYLADRETIEVQAGRLAAMGYHAVPPRNPYWDRMGVTIADPDGWRVVLAEPVDGAP